MDFPIKITNGAAIHLAQILNVQGALTKGKDIKRLRQIWRHIKPVTSRPVLNEAKNDLDVDWAEKEIPEFSISDACRDVVKVCITNAIENKKAVASDFFGEVVEVFFPGDD